MFSNRQYDKNKKYIKYKYIFFKINHFYCELF